MIGVLPRPTLSALLKVVVGWTVIAALALAWADRPEWIRLFAGLPLVLFSPGFVLSSLVLPGRTISLGQRVLLSAGLSLVIVIVVALLGQTAAVPITTLSWNLALSGFTVAAGLGALIRRSETQPTQPGWMISPLPIVLGCIAIGIAAGAFDTTRLAAMQASNGSVALWVRPVTPSNGYELGVENGQLTRFDGRIVLTVAESVVMEWTDISLLAGDSWSTAIDLPSRLASGEDFALVLIDDQNQPVRRVWVRPTLADSTGEATNRTQE